MNTNLLIVRVVAVLTSEAPTLDMDAAEAAVITRAIEAVLTDAEQAAPFLDQLHDALDGVYIPHIGVTPDGTAGDAALAAADLLHMRAIHGRAF